MFLDNKYTRLYYKIISKSDIEGYTEKHHIIPRSMGGSDDPSNIVSISARKHFLCHYLLIKMTKGPNFWKMIKAFHMMHTINNDSHQRYINSRLYQSIKEHFSQSMSISQSGENNSQFGTVWIYCPYTFVSKKIPKIEVQSYLDNGCIKGRIQNIESYIKKMSKKPYNKNDSRGIRPEKQEYYEYIYHKFIESGLSMSKFSKIHKISIGNLHRIYHMF